MTPQMQIETTPEMRLTLAHEAEIAALLARCFDTDFGGRSFFQQRHHLRVMARMPGLAGHVAVTFRAIRVGDQLVDVAGLAEVATDPDYRGKGIATALLQAAIAETKASQARHLLLFGTAGIYPAAGFVPAHNPMTWIDLTGARLGAVRSQPAKTLMVLSLGKETWDETAPIDFLGNLF
jgi:predicted N-acetyltransferase YhbS